MVDAGKAIVGVFPTDPGLDLVVGGVEIDRERAEGNSEEDLNTSQTHETNVSVGAEVVVRRKEFIKLGATLIKSDYA